MSEVIYVQCVACAGRYRIERIEPHNHPVNDVRYCPGCSAEDLREELDWNLEYWYALSRSLGFAPTVQTAKLIRELYNMWDATEYRTFREFVFSENRYYSA